MKTWWRHQTETFSVLLAICAENSPVTGEFPSQRPVTRSFDVFFDLRLNTRLSKPSRRHGAHYDVTIMKESMKVVGSSQCHRERCTTRVTRCTCSAVRAPYWHWYSPLFIRPHWSRSEWGLVWKQWLFLRRWIPGRPVWQVGDNRHLREKLGSWGGVVVRKRTQNQGWF